MSNYPQGDAFIDLLLAAMHDAALEGKITQIKSQFTPEGKKKMEEVRIIIVPEKMNWNWPKTSPAGTPFS